MNAKNKWNKKILAVLLEWDYGDRRRGPSLEREFFYKNLSALAAQVEPFWYDDHLNDPPGLQKQLINKATDFNPDLIFFVPYQDQFSPQTLDYLKSRWPTMAWFGDDSWRFETYTAKNAPHYSYSATTDIFSVTKYQKLGINPIATQWAGQGGDMNLGPVPPVSYDHQVSFVGGNNLFRSWYIKRLETLGVKVDCFGAGWPAGKVSFDQMNRIFYKSRINLNLSNSVNQDIRFILSGPGPLVNYLRSGKRYEQMKARNFEIPLAGGFQLTNYVAGLENYLKVGDEVAVYATPEECAQQIKYYLANEEKRLNIAINGQRRAQGEHTYYHRLEALLKAIWK
ncbi:glycosyltransferase family 1 protein [candidate division TA06 bacterium]|uniref:Glycosyltransferase family 1 protein n=1 Tax=candidate division TA06 bacterium TaxID=2250710 RepID=A0A933MIP9_UNCT6|nr:glycosyltransferase family 1 protein [candidate division TA06 bacterium]